MAEHSDPLPTLALESGSRGTCRMRKGEKQDLSYPLPAVRGQGVLIIFKKTKPTADASWLLRRQNNASKPSREAWAWERPCCEGLQAHKHQDNWGLELQSLSDLGQVPSPLRASVSPAVKLELCSGLSGSQPVGLDSWGPVFMAINHICTVAKPISLTSTPAPAPDLLTGDLH